MKSLVARTLAKRVQEGEVIGLGSGSTVELAIDQIAQRISRDGLRVSGVPTSYRTALVAKQAGIQVLSSIPCPKLSWAFDGADEVDPDSNLIKGRGAAMLSEKIIARQSKGLVIIVSENKLVDQLGKRFPVPVEVVPEAVQLVEEALLKLGARECNLREAVNKYGPVVTEHNNLILDAWFNKIEVGLEQEINSLTGVVENGLFIGFRPELLIARQDGVWSRRFADGKTTETLLESP